MFISIVCLGFILASKKKTAEIIMSPDRKVKAIKLKKDARGALGIVNIIRSTLFNS